MGERSIEIYGRKIPINEDLQSGLTEEEKQSGAIAIDSFILEAILKEQCIDTPEKIKILREKARDNTEKILRRIIIED